MDYSIEFLPTCTQRKIMSANRDKDFAVYSPLIEASTIFHKASMSWSWGIAHLTRNCSPLLRSLMKDIQAGNIKSPKLRMQPPLEKLLSPLFDRVILPVIGFSTGQEFQHHNPEAVNITSDRISSRFKLWSSITICWLQMPGQLTYKRSN